MIADLDGGVRAMIGGRDYGASQFNRATDALRQPGSSFKPYVYATALANGFTPSSVVDDSPVCIGNWCPHNYSGGYSGPVTLLEAITHSINVIPVKLSIMLGKGNPKLGRAMIVQTARNFGINTPLPDTPSLPIGADGVNVLEHAVAYATFPNLGRAVAPHAALEVRTDSGQLVWRFDRDGPKPRQVITPEVAVEMIKMHEFGGRERHRPARAARRHADLRQDRHHQRLARRLVRRLHRKLRRRGLDGQ